MPAKHTNVTVFLFVTFISVLTIIFISISRPVCVGMLKKDKNDENQLKILTESSIFMDMNKLSGLLNLFYMRYPGRMPDD